MSILGFIISGFIIGLLARAIKPGKDSLGIIMTTLLGIAGAVVAGYLGQALNLYTPGEPAGWIASILGAILLLVVAHLAFSRRSRV
jgi:uncharacterized membrane protein YeaQ/YmgE (transglycosylase-associated protein family)